MLKFISGLVSSIIVLQLTGCAAFVGAGAAGMMLAPDRRTTGTIIDDQTLKIKTQLAINSDKEIRDNSHIATLMYNKTLLLVGQVANERIRQKAFETAASIPCIDKIYNEVYVACPTTIKRRSCDSWITTRVKLNLWTSREIGPGRISVITEDGVVYLLGMLTPEERYAACNIARKVPGVKRIVQLFDPIYTDNTDEAPIG